MGEATRALPTQRVNLIAAAYIAGQGCTLYLIDHGNGTSLGHYKNPNNLLAAYPRLRGGIQPSRTRRARRVLDGE